MVQSPLSQRTIFQFFAVRLNENNSDVGEEDTQDDSPLLEFETALLPSHSGSSHDPSRTSSSTVWVPLTKNKSRSETTVRWQERALLLDKQIDSYINNSELLSQTANKYKTKKCYGKI